MDLSNLIANKKEINIPFPGMEGFSVKLAFVSKDALRKLSDKSKVLSFDKARQPIETIDDKLFSKLYTGEVILGWEGFKFEYLKELLVVDDSAMPTEGEIEFSPENAVSLVSNSAIFDGWVSSILSDIANFNKGA